MNNNGGRKVSSTVMYNEDWTESRLDLYAAGLSTLCLIHCLALPLLASLLPLAGQLSENELVHQGLVLLAAPATLWAGWRSLSTNGGLPFIVAAFSGLGLLLLAAFIDALSTFEQPMTVIGALLLASAHFWRWARYRQRSLLRNVISEADDLSGE